MLEKIKKPEICTDKVLGAWNLPEDISVSDWADRNRVLGNEAAEPGQWRTDRTPYLRVFMDTFKDPLIEKITIMFPAQSGKTEGMFNMIGYAIDQDPGPMLLVDSTEDIVKDLCKERIQPMIRLCSALSAHLTDNEDDVSQKGIKFDRMSIYLAWSNSPATLASRPIRYVFLNEVDKYPPFSGKESSPPDLAAERTRTFYNRKIVQNSTPTTKNGVIYKEYQKSDMRQFYVPCPHCGEYQTLVLGQIKFPKDQRDPKVILEKKLAHYECRACKGIINDNQKIQMLHKGVWVPNGCSINKKAQISYAGVILNGLPRTSHAGFWINCLYSPWLTFPEIIAKWLDCQSDPEKLMNFVNSWLAEPWEENLGTKKPDELRRLAGHCAAKQVPADAQILVAAVDAQQDHFYFTIRAWGFHQKSWQILSMRVETWEEIEHYLIDSVYPSEIESIGNFQVRLFAVDSGDGNRTSEVYDFCRKWRDIAIPTKGLRSITGIPYKVSQIDKYPNGQTMPGGLKLYLLDTTYFKDKITRLVENTREDAPGGWYFHKDPDDDYLNQFCSEHKTITRDRKGRATVAWTPVKVHGKTHYWDCEVYAAAVAEILHIFSMQEDGGKHVQRPDQDSQKSTWIPKKSGWIKHA